MITRLVNGKDLTPGSLVPQTGLSYNTVVGVASIEHSAWHGMGIP